jgi:hypothetical protein
VRDSTFVSKATLTLGCGLLAVGALACSGDDAPTTNDLTADLGILREQQGLTAAEVRCVADHAREALSGDELERFADDLADLARTSKLSSMRPSSRATLTEAITACAGG